MGNRVIFQLREAVVPMVGTFGSPLTYSSTLSNSMKFYNKAQRLSRTSTPSLASPPRARLHSRDLPTAEVRQKRSLFSRYPRGLVKKPSFQGIRISIKRTVDCFIDDDGAIGKQSMCILAMVPEAGSRPEETAPARTDSEAGSVSDIHESHEIVSSSRIINATEIDARSSCSSCVWEGTCEEYFAADDESAYMTTGEPGSRSWRGRDGTNYIPGLGLELGEIDTWKQSLGFGHDRS